EVGVAAVASKQRRGEPAQPRLLRLCPKRPRRNQRARQRPVRRASSAPQAKGAGRVVERRDRPSASVFLRVEAVVALVESVLLGREAERVLERAKKRQRL